VNRSTAKIDAMHDTSASLLERLRIEPDAASWQRLADLYTPLLHIWLSRYSLQRADEEDLVQEVLGAVVREMPQFVHNEHKGAFRRWLRNILVNRLRNFWRSRQQRPIATGDSDFASMLDELEDPSSGLSRLWDQEHDRIVVRRLLDLIEPEFASSTWRAFRSVMFEGKKEDIVSTELGISVNAVFIAKSRVLSRLRQEMKGLVG
jgi:RNA polymerase sigma-70 factor (ECF subfamily)